MYHCNVLRTGYKDRRGSSNLDEHHGEDSSQTHCENIHSRKWLS